MSSRKVLVVGNEDGFQVDGRIYSLADRIEVGGLVTRIARRAAIGPAAVESKRRAFSSDRLAGRFSWLGLVAPFAAEKLTATVFGNHRRYAHHTHDEKNREEDNCNHEDWHTAPLAPLCVVVELASVTAITGRCEEGLRWPGLESESTSSDSDVRAGLKARVCRLFSRSGGCPCSTS